MSRIIAITGASSGIGLALAKKLAQPGNHLILLARRVEILEDLAAEARQAGAEATVEEIDFRVKNAWQTAHRALAKKGLEIDTIYHCAVRISAGAVHHTLPEDWEEIYRVNLLSTTSILGTLYPEMARRGHGTIVLFTSLTSLGGGPMAAPYASAKTAILGAWRSLQYESRRTGVAVHLISPSLVDTPIFENFILRKVTSQQIRQCMLATRLPITPPDVAARKIIDNVAKGKRYIVFPLKIAIYVFFARRFPAIASSFVRQSNRIFGIQK